MNLNFIFFWIFKIFWVNFINMMKVYENREDGDEKKRRKIVGDDAL